VVVDNLFIVCDGFSRNEKDRIKKGTALYPFGPISEMVKYFLSRQILVFSNMELFPKLDCRSSKSSKIDIDRINKLVWTTCAKMLWDAPGTPSCLSSAISHATV
jgi:hypothetical protein